jgi:hypothetical protein
VKKWRFVSRLVFGCVLGAAEQSKELALLTLEAYAARPTAEVIWSKDIGHLKSRYAKARFTVVILEDRTAEPGRMRGLRIDLAHAGESPNCDWKYLAWRILCQRPDAAVWVTEDRLEPVRYGITRGAAELRLFEFVSQYGNPDTSGPGRSGMILCGYDFSGRSSRELAAFFARAITELEKAPR